MSGNRLFAAFVLMVLVFGCVEEAPPTAGVPENVTANISANATQPNVTVGVTPVKRADLAKLYDIVTGVDLNALPPDVVNYTYNNAYFVAKNGSDSNDGSLGAPFATIEHALETAKDGDAVFVREGRYKTNTLIIDGSDFLLAAYGNEKAVLEKSEDNLGIEIDGDVSNVILDGIRIKGFETGIVYGDPKTQENITIKNVRMDDVMIGIENDYPTHTDYLVDGLLIKNLTLQNVTGIGVQCGDEYNKCAKNVLLQNVFVYGAGNLSDDTSYDSLAMVNTDNVLVLDSVFSDAPGDGLDFKATRVSVVNTIAANPNRNGMKFWNDGEMINCIAYGTGADAAVVFDPEKDGTRFRMINSVIAQHLMDVAAAERQSYAMTFGYDFQKASNIEMKNSIIYDMPGPIYFNDNSTLDLQNNVFYGFVHGDRFMVYGNDDWSNIASMNAESYASGNKYADPNFADASAHDFRLASGSPAIDGGVSGKGIPDFDVLWKTRPLGNGIDVGAYEQ